MPAAQLQREVKQLVDEWLPTLETNAAQTDVEVLELLLRQLGYPSNPSEEVRGAWLGGGAACTHVPLCARCGA